MTNLIYPDEWHQIAQEILILQEKKVIFVLGGVDTGKTTFITFLANYLFNNKKIVSVVDSDIGQSDIGPPTTIAGGILKNNIQSLTDVELSSMYFVGDISPENNIPEMLVGVKKIVDIAKENSEYVLINTTGLVSGKIGYYLKTSKIEIIKPDVIVAFQKKQELNAILELFKNSIKIYNLKVSPYVKNKDREQRRINRENRFREYFSNAKLKTISLDDITVHHPFFKKGRKINHQEIKFISDEICDIVFYGEVTNDTLFLVSYCDNYNSISLQNHFKVDKINIVNPEYFKNLIISFQDEYLNTICLAIIKEINFKNNSLDILIDENIFNKTKIIKFGNYRFNFENNLQNRK